MKKNNSKEFSVIKTSQHGLQNQVRQQIDELDIKSAQIKQGVNREKIAEAEIQIRTKAMEAALDGIFIINAQNQLYNMIYVNQSFLNMSGYVKNKVIGHDFFELFRAAENKGVLVQIKSTLDQGKAFIGDVLSILKNGNKIWSSLRISPVLNSKGVITHFVGIQTDITVMKQRDLKIEQQREELLHVTRVGKLAEFVSSLAHEISQPLTAILAYAQAAQRMYGHLDPQLQEVLQFIVNDDLRATEVIRRLRSLLKKTKPAFEPLNMNTLINDTVMLIMTDIIVRNKIIKFDLAKGLPLIKGDRIQLQQVLLNLISNSLEAMSGVADSRELSIRTFLKDPKMMMVEVIDAGCGIPDENLKKLFGNFFTSKPDGLGMGLSISRSIIEAHGGQLEGRNNPDRGAAFYFTIPALKKINT